MINFYDQAGVPIAYTEDLQNIYLFSGEPVAYIDGDSIYSYSGEHLGWFVNGWVIDHNGDNVYFSENTKGGPFKPLKQFLPFKGFKGFLPFKGFKELKPFKPVVSLGWSDMANVSFFYQH